MSDMEEERAIVALAYGHIVTQIELATEATSWWKRPQRYRRARDAFARGYVMGFCDAIIQTKGINDDVRCAALCSLVFIRLSGADAGARLAGEALREMGHGDSHAGQKCGLQDFAKWRKAAVSNDKPPLPSALFHHIIGRSR